VAREKAKQTKKHIEVDDMVGERYVLGPLQFIPFRSYTHLAEFLQGFSEVHRSRREDNAGVGAVLKSRD